MNPKNFPKKLPTIVDVAKLAGVHPSTVSRVFSGKVPVDSKTEASVRYFAQKIGYKANHAARSLVTGVPKTPIVGLVVPSLIHPFYQEIIRGIDSVFLSTSVNLMLFNLRGENQRMVEKILSEDLAGVILISVNWTDSQWDQFTPHQTPQLVLDHECQRAPTFQVDQEAGGKLAAGYLLENGATKIAFVGETTQTPQQEGRFQGFYQEILRQGKTLFWKKRVAQDFNASENFFLSLRERDLPDGIFCFCDEIAWGVAAAVKKRGLNCRIVGFDDLPASRYLGLTTIAQPAFEMGVLGARGILEFEKNGYSTKNTILQPALKIRST